LSEHKNANIFKHINIISLQTSKPRPPAFPVHGGNDDDDVENDNDRHDEDDDDDSDKGRSDDDNGDYMYDEYGSDNVRNMSAITTFSTTTSPILISGMLITNLFLNELLNCLACFLFSI
jgi:hypothetical protein